MSGFAGFGDDPTNNPGQRGDKALPGHSSSDWNPGVGQVPPSRHGSSNDEGFDAKYDAQVAPDGGGKTTPGVRPRGKRPPSID